DEATGRSTAEMAVVGHGYQVAQILQFEIRNRHDLRYMASIGMMQSIDWNYQGSGLRLPSEGFTSAHSCEGATMLGIGRQFPQFSLTGVVSNDMQQGFKPITSDSFPGKWRVVF